MKIAFSTEDGKHVSQSFAWAPYYLVLTVEKEKVVHREMRLKMSNIYLKSRKYQDHTREEYQFSIGVQGNYNWMAQGIADCDVLIGREINDRASGPLHLFGIDTVSTKCMEIDHALQEYMHYSPVAA